MLVRPVRPSPGIPEGAALWYLVLIVGISIDAWGGFGWVCFNMFVFMTTAYDANLGPIFTGFCNVLLAAIFSTPALPVRKNSKIWASEKQISLKV